MSNPFRKYVGGGRALLASSAVARYKRSAAKQATRSRAITYPLNADKDGTNDSGLCIKQKL